MQRAEQFYERYGWSAVVVARFVPWARTFTPVLAGVAGMARPRFVAATLVGAALWGAGLVTVGYAAHDLPWLRTVAYAVAAAAIAGSLIAPLVGYFPPPDGPPGREAEVGEAVDARYSRPVGLDRLAAPGRGRR